MAGGTQPKSGGMERVPFYIVYHEDAGYMETYGGAQGAVILEGQHLKPKTPRGNTALIFMHPTGVMNLLPMPNALARAGVGVITCASRYPGNDSALIMEKVVVDMGQVVKYAKERLGYETVVLAGWSGGGSLSLFYQSQAEHPTITETPAGDPFDMAAAELIPADGMMQLAAHVSRAKTFTEWMDPSVIDESDPDGHDLELNLYDPACPHQPPYTAEFLQQFAEAQIARNRKITAWVREQLADLRARTDGNFERAFITHGTMMAPCWLDPAVDPNDREPGTCYLGEPRMVNNGPVGLARFSTMRSWLSQWSYDDSNADAETCAPRISVPAMVISNGADNACLPSQADRIYNALPDGHKERHVIHGASHYYLGQPDKLAEAVRLCIDWLERKGLLA